MNDDDELEHARSSNSRPGHLSTEYALVVMHCDVSGWSHSKWVQSTARSAIRMNEHAGSEMGIHRAGPRRDSTHLILSNHL